ncbi:MAG TPA: zinc ribbon domain-containing protein [Terriglobales bacterium]|nr:zinc ribbon domain-containing protein [Terriglobales bacterium]
MYCDSCGTVLQTGQAFCGRCGKEVRGGTPISYPHPSRVREHVRLLGILWIGYSAFHVVGAVVLMVVANTILAHPWTPGYPHVPGFLSPLLSAIAVLLLAKAVAGFAAGWGLLQRESWARVLSLVVAFISLFNVPLGTALGIYTLWVLLPSQSDQEYEEHVRAA